MNEGRPTKYLKKYCKEFVDLSRKGKTKTQIADQWDLDRETLAEWGKKHDEFSAALKKGNAALESWYTNFGMNIAAGKMPKANVTAFIWLSKNCIGWRDKQEVKHSIDDIEFEDED